MSEAQRSAKSAEWGTPERVIAACAQSMGGRIQLDLCSSSAHQLLIGADEWYGRDHSLPNHRDALLQCDTYMRRGVFCNPPGSSRGVQPWWTRWQLISSGIWLGFNMNQLAYLDPFPLDRDSANWIFVPRKRLRFRGAGDNPPHNSYLVGRDCDPGPLIEAMEGSVKYL